jgi:predicted ATPase
MGCPAQHHRGVGRVRTGQSEDGLAQIREGLSVLAKTGHVLFHHHFVAMFAEVLGKTGRVDEGLSVLEEAIEGSQRAGIAYWESELRRRKGELLLASDGADRAAAEACLRRALQIAQEQGAKSLELRAATRLAQLWGSQGSRQRAVDLLAPVLGWFTEGFGSADLREAHKLLDELREG